MLRKQYDVLLLQYVCRQGRLWFLQWQRRFCLQTAQSLSEFVYLMGFSPSEDKMVAGAGRTTEDYCLKGVNAGGNNSIKPKMRIDFPEVCGTEGENHSRKYKFEKEAA